MEWNGNNGVHILYISWAVVSKHGIYLSSDIFHRQVVLMKKFYNSKKRIKEISQLSDTAKKWERGMEKR